MSTGLRDLKLWQEACALAGDVGRAARAARAAPRRELQVLTDRLILAGCAVPEAVADAHGRYDARDQQRAYRTARRALLVLETDIAIARHAELLSAPLLAQLSGRTTAVARLLAGYLAFLERQIEAAESSRSPVVPERPAQAGPVPTAAPAGGATAHASAIAPGFQGELDTPATASEVFVEP